MNDFLNNNSSAIFGLLGAMVGSVATLIVNRLEFGARNREKIIDDQINAHKNIIVAIKDLRDTTEYKGSLHPCFLQNKSTLAEWINSFFRAVNDNSSWLSEDTLKELFFFQQYCFAVVKITENVKKPEYIRNIGNILSSDFQDFANIIENHCFQYLNNKAIKGKVIKFSQWPMYTEEEVWRRNQRMALFVRKTEIDKYMKH